MVLLVQWPGHAARETRCGPWEAEASLLFEWLCPRTFHVKLLHLPWNKMSNVFTFLGYKQVGKDLCLSTYSVIKEIGHMEEK